MSEISLKSITGITSITTPTGVDNQLTVHNNNTTEAQYAQVYLHSDAAVNNVYGNSGYGYTYFRGRLIG